ncbi:MAG: hypothetical protein ABR606_17645 [Vicinamibacterales bacterium]
MDRGTRETNDVTTMEMDAIFTPSRTLDDVDDGCVDGAHRGRHQIEVAGS